jgi:hypothetical protein
MEIRATGQRGPTHVLPSNYVVQSTEILADVARATSAIQLVLLKLPPHCRGATPSLTHGISPIVPEPFKFLTLGFIRDLHNDIELI